MKKSKKRDAKKFKNLEEGIIKAKNKIEDLESKLEVKLKPEPNGCKKYTFRPDKELISTLNRWFGCCRKVYNNAVNYLNKKNNKSVDLKDLREECITKGCVEPKVEQKDKVYYDSKDNELRKAVRAFKNPERKKKLKFRSKKLMFRETFSIPYKHLKLKNDNVNIRLIKDILSSIEDHIDINSIDYEILISKTKTEIYSLNIPVRKETIKKSIENQDRVKIVSIDPGSRTPFTCYDPSGKSFKISENKIDSLFKYSLRRDKINSKIEELKKLKSLKIYDNEKQYRRGCRRIKRLILARHKLQERVNNVRKQFHYDTIKHLLQNYEVVLIPEFETKEMMKKTKERKLNKIGVRKLGLWNHSMFKQRLLQKAELLGKYIIINDEKFTTKTCGKCGTLNDVKSKKSFTCEKCKVDLDRDINASRNILLRFLSMLKNG